MALPSALLFLLLAGNVLLRFFTNRIQLLPKFLNVWDVYITIALALLVFVYPSNPPAGIDTRKMLKRLLIFDFICIVGSLLNTEHVALRAAVSQMIMWNEPIVLFLALLHLPLGRVEMLKFRKLLLFLIVLEVIIGIFQVPIYLSTGASEVIIGTFNGNAEQYQFFVLLGFFYLLAQRDLLQTGKRIRLLTALGILVLVILIDNKASWLSLLITLLLFLPKLPSAEFNQVMRWRAYALVAVIIGLGYGTVQMFSDSAGKKFSGLAEAYRTGNLLNLGKVKALRDVLSAYGGNLQMGFVGSGLGTFYSRAAFQYFPFRVYENYNNASGVAARPNSDDAFGTERQLSDSRSVQLSRVTDKTAFYKEFYSREKIFAVGSGTADFPTSSYISLLGETGIIGTLLYLSFYRFGWRAARSGMLNARGDRTLFAFAAVTYASLIYLMLMGFYNYWLDSGRVNTIVWAMLALVIKAQTEAAQQQDAGGENDLITTEAECVQ